MGAWIEIGYDKLPPPQSRMSLPLWERGLKFGRAFLVVKIANVAPSMGAWIEIDGSMGLTKEEMVAPSMGAWIEIREWQLTRSDILSRSLYGSVD